MNDAILVGLILTIFLIWILYLCFVSHVLTEDIGLALLLALIGLITICFVVGGLIIIGYIYVGLLIILGMMSVYKLIKGK